MPTGYPFQAPPLTIEIDAGSSGIPLYESVVEAKRETAKVVAPHEFGYGGTGDAQNDVRNCLVAQRVQSRKMSESGFLSHPPKVRDDPERVGVCFSALGAGDGNRTRVISLEDWSSTIELRPHCRDGGAY